MEFIKSNLILTSSALTVYSNTLAAKNILNRDLTFQYVTEGFADDSLPTSMIFSFDSTTTIDRAAIMGMNLKDFSLFYNGATASTFALTTGDTSASEWSSNSNTSMYLRFTPVNVTSVTLDMRKTMVANSEKAVGFFSLSELKLDFPRIPSAKDYNPIFEPTEIVHKMSDGGTRIHYVSEKRSASIKLNNITETFRNSLKTIKDERTDFGFVAFGTTTGWDEFYFDCVWPGRFDFFKYSDDALEAGYVGKIDLRET